jgi:hypothetical protein
MTSSSSDAVAPTSTYSSISAIDRGHTGLMPGVMGVAEGILEAAAEGSKPKPDLTKLIDGASCVGLGLVPHWRMRYRQRS